MSACRKHFPERLQRVSTEEEAGRKLCLPVPVGVAQPQSYWLLISQLWRPKERERDGEEDRCVKVCETLPYETWIFSPTCVPAHQFSSFLTHTHTCSSIQIRTHAHPSHIHSMTPSFFPCELCVSSIYVIPVSCKIGVSSADWGCCSLRAMHRVIHDDSLSSAIRGCLHHQLAQCRQRSKWPLFSGSNDKAVCIHSQKDSPLTFTCKLIHMHTHILYVYHAEVDLYIRGSILLSDIGFSKIYLYYCRCWLICKNRCSTQCCKQCIRYIDRY